MMTETTEKASRAEGTANALASQVARMNQDALKMDTDADSTTQMGPGEGVRSTALDASGLPRLMQYRPGFNLPTQPGSDRRVDYDTLSFLADNYDVLRKALEVRKDEICTLPWDIIPRERDKRKAKQRAESESLRISKIKRRFDRPDGRNHWQSWLRKGLEDYFVYDAMSLSTLRNLGGDVIGWRWLDGSTIKPRLDITGEIPVRPGVAYQQYLFGLPHYDFFEANDPMDYREAIRRWRAEQKKVHNDFYNYPFYMAPNATNTLMNPGELRYRPRNKRNKTPYGYSHVESFLTHINIALRWQLWEQAFWVEGNIPSAIVAVPPDWTQNQIRDYQEWWDTLTAGDPGAQRSLRFVPGGSKVFDVEASLEHSTEFAQYLITITLMIMDVNRQEVGLEPLNSGGLGGKSFSQGMSEQTYRVSLKPTAQWLKQEVFDPLIQIDLGYEEYEWSWPTLDQQMTKEEAEMNQILITTGQKSLDDILIENGDEPTGIDRFIVLGNKPYFLKDLQEMSEKGAIAVEQKQQMALAKAKPAGIGVGSPNGDQKGKTRNTVAGETHNQQERARASRQNKPAPTGAQAPKAAEPDSGVVEEMERWQRKAIKAFKAGKDPCVRFASDIIPENVYEEINEKLTDAGDLTSVRAAFMTENIQEG